MRIDSIVPKLLNYITQTVEHFGSLAWFKHHSIAFVLLYNMRLEPSSFYQVDPALHNIKIIKFQYYHAVFVEEFVEYLKFLQLLPSR